MEYKVRQESHSFLEKLFHDHAKSGIVDPSVVPTLLRDIDSEIAIDPEHIIEPVPEVDVSSVGEEGLDWESFEKVMIHYLAKQSKKDSNEFAYKQDITLADFDSP